MIRPPHTSRAFLVLLTCLLLAGCAAADEAVPLPAERIITVKPPEPIFEEKLIAENPMLEAWRPGHWVYNGSAFSWIPGELIAKPAPSAVWSQDRWEQRAYGWAFVVGYWR